MEKQEEQMMDVLEKSRFLAKHGKLDESLSLLDQLIQQAIVYYENDQTHPKMAPFYYHYGNILLSKVESNDDIFTQQVQQQQYYKAQQENNQNSIQNGNGLNKESENESDNESVNQIEDKQGGNDSDNSQIQEEEEVEDIQLVFENLEVARSIVQNNIQQLQGQEQPLIKQYSFLSDIHSRIGDYYVYKEQYDQARTEYQECLNYRIKTEDPVYSKAIAEVYILINGVLQLENPENYEDEAIVYIKKAQQIIQNNIKKQMGISLDQQIDQQELTQKAQTDQELNDLQGFNMDMQYRIEDLVLAKQQRKQVQMEKMMQSNNEVKETVQEDKQEQPKQIINLGVMGNARKKVKKEE